MTSSESNVSRRPFPIAAMLVATSLATSLLAAAPTVLAQDGGGGAGDSGSGTQDAARDLSGVRRNVADFIHYVLIGKADLATAAAEALLGASVGDKDLAIAVDQGELGDRLATAVSRSRAMGGVSDLATRIENRVENGRRALARDPQRIAEAIGMLGKTLRERRLGEERLLAAGEYAVPQLLKVLLDSNDPQVELVATKNLEALKRHAVLPLSMALVNLPADGQRAVVGILGQIGYPSALPFIVEVANAPGTPTEVKAACAAAFAQLGGSTEDVSAQFTALARRFFDREDALVPNPGESYNNLWSFDGSAGGFAGLGAEQVATSIFCDVMAMTLARRALAADASNVAALALYVASDLRRENTLGSDATPGRYSPQFFATASGPSVCSAVLSLAIDRKDTALIRDAIGALAQTASPSAMVAPSGRAPMLEALSYADRRVRLDAARAIANSAPRESFPGDHTVVPTLAASIIDASGNRAAILGGSLEERQAIGQQLETAGFVPVAGAEVFDALEVDVVRANGVDLVVVRGAVEDLKSAIGRVRASGLTSASPVVAIANPLEETAVRRAFADDRSVMVWTEGGTAETFRGAAVAAMTNSSGSVMEEAEGAEYSLLAAEALRSIAHSGTKTFSVADAEPALLKALSEKQGQLRMVVAEILSIHASAAAQSALVEAAITSNGLEQIALCDFAAAAARSSGLKADERQLSALRELIASAEGEFADAAGRLYGALDAGPAEVIKLITE